MEYATYEGLVIDPQNHLAIVLWVSPGLGLKTRWHGSRGNQRQHM
jgi:hypothetical protein